MRFGTFHLMEQPFSKSEAQVYEEQMAQMRLANELGFDSMWLLRRHEIRASTLAWARTLASLGAASARGLQLRSILT